MKLNAEKAARGLLLKDATPEEKAAAEKLTAWERELLWEGRALGMMRLTETILAKLEATETIFAKLGETDV